MNTIHTYNSYLNSKVLPIITLEESQKLYEELTNQLDLNDEICVELWKELLQKCFKYANIRSNWSLLSREEKMDTDASRTMVHDSVITGFNMMERYCEKAGKDTGWRTILGPERKRIGDFACYIAYIYGINNR